MNPTTHSQRDEREHFQNSNRQSSTSPSGQVEAEWWHFADDGRIACDLCPRDCRLKPGDRGFCFVRQNVDGQMKLTTYGRSTGFCIDPIEKKPLNHFLPGTPVLSGVWASCAGGPITSITPGAPFAISGQGIDTSNGVIVWKLIGAVGAPEIAQNFLSTTGGPGGEVCSYPTTPLTPGSNIGAPALTPGNWLVTIRYNGIYGTSADSNGIVITVP